MDTLPLNHFLNLPRPPIVIGPPVGVPDTTTVAAHDFDVDTLTGFMPPKAPIERLPEQWAPWEDVLSDAIRSRLQLGDKSGLTDAEAHDSLRWRETVKNMPELSISDLKSSEVLLRRTHLVLAWIMHFYVHSLPPTEPVLIPSPLTLPLLQVSAELQLPPVITYSDDVLYNWRLIPSANPSTDHDGTFHSSSSSDKDIPTISTIQCQTTFTSTPDEEEFYLSSARLELAGVAALDLMRSTMDEAWVGDDIAIRRITDNLVQLSSVIRRLRQLLLDVKNGCSPDVFYHQIRPWVRGADSATQSGRPWVFEGMDKDPSLEVPVELSGASAGQSSLIHALDIFLGVEKYSHGKDLTGHSSPSSSSTSSSHSGSASTPNSHPLQAQAVSTSSSSPSSSSPSHAHQPQSHTDETSSSSPSPSNAEASTRKTAFLKRMQLYMPRHHRAFLTHLSNNPRPLRDLVFNAATNNSSRTETPTQSQKDGQALLDAYNGAVMALKEFRDAHMIIVALYIIGPARRKDAALAAAGRETRGGDVSEYVGSGSTQDKGKRNEVSAQPLKGTGGTELVRFLKDVRDQTKNAVLNI